MDFRCPADWSPELPLGLPDRKAEEAQVKNKQKNTKKKMRSWCLQKQARWWPGAAGQQHLPAVGLLALPRARAARAAQLGGPGEMLWGRGNAELGSLVAGHGGNSARMCPLAPEGIGTRGSALLGLSLCCKRSLPGRVAGIALMRSLPVPISVLPDPRGDREVRRGNRASSTASIAAAGTGREGAGGCPHAAGRELPLPSPCISASPLWLRTSSRSPLPGV